MRRVSDSRVMQSGNKISDTFAALCGLLEREALPAIHSLGRYPVPPIHCARRAGRLDRANSASNMAHVISPDNVVMIAYATCMSIAIGEQETRGFQPSRREHVAPAAHGETLAP